MPTTMVTTPRPRDRDWCNVAVADLGDSGGGHCSDQSIRTQLEEQSMTAEVSTFDQSLAVARPMGEALRQENAHEHRVIDERVARRRD